MFFFFFLSLFLFDLLLRPPTESRFSCQPIVCVCVRREKKGENAVLDSDKDGASSQVKGLVIVSNRNGSSEFILLKL